MREPGDVLLVACYELGHQPLAVAWPAAFLERAGYRPALMDTSVEPVDAQKVARAKVVAVSVPMHTALRLGLEVAARVRAVNPGAHVCFFGLYATLNADYPLRPRRRQRDRRRGRGPAAGADRRARARRARARRRASRGRGRRPRPI